MTDDLRDLDDPELEAEVRDLMARGLTIDAIKTLRARSGWSLGEAKLWVDHALKDVADRRQRGTKPCPSCGQPLRTDVAKQCFACGTDWH